MLGIYKYEYAKSNEDIVKFIITNGLNSDLILLSEANALLQCKIFKERYYVITEVNDYIYKVLTRRDRMFIGWSRYTLIIEL